MQENDLIKYYKNHISKDGYLDISKIDLVKYPEIFQSSGSAKKYKTPIGDIYKKHNKYFEKECVDAEVLLSQVYIKAGLKSAIYVPAKDEKNVFVLSNDIENEQNVLARDFHCKIAKAENLKPEEARETFTDDKNISSAILRHYTKRGLQKKTTERVLDCGTFNTDRHHGNYYYEINSDGKANDIVVIDNGRSGEEASYYSLKGHVYWDYENDFGESMTMKTLINKLKNSEVVASNVSLSKVAEDIGSVNVFDVAGDIKHSIGYQVSADYVNLLDKQITECAEMLVK